MAGSPRIVHTESLTYKSPYKELLRIIRFPGYTTPAEFAFTVAMVDSMAAQVSVLARQEQDLLAAGKQVVAKASVAA
jgi:hypothetical protein